MKGDPRISSIYHQANAPAPIGEEADRRNIEARRSMWHAKGLLVIDPEDEIDDFFRQYLIGMGDKLYGRRRGKARNHG